MPERTVETNGATRPVAQKSPETRERIAIDANANMTEAVRGYNELIASSTKYYVDALDKSVLSGLDIASRAERALEDIFTFYRRSYIQGLKSWQNYIDEVGRIIMPPR